MPRAKTYQTEAIIIKKTKLGEADRILTLYTPELGKIQGVAKGIRRPKAKLAGHLEMLTHSMVSLVHGHNLDTIIGSQTINSFLPLKCDLELGACALYATELVGQFATERQENRPLFGLLLEMMQQLSSLDRPAEGAANNDNSIKSGVHFPSPSMGEGQDGGDFPGKRESAFQPRRHDYHPDTSGLLRYFEVHLLHEAGYRPQLELCVACRRPLPQVTTYFSAAAGGVLCTDCRHKQSFSYPLSAGALSVLRALQEADWSAACQTQCDGRVQQEMETVMRHYLRYLLERDIRSAAWLDTLKGIQQRRQTPE
ncbi:MAG: hypothetical protein A2147_08465 [Chloroflexi bacterium RBG_16_57_8]|nr:MAG: hypothetical protein A2147_08465 [Chloroflexi bacterium RBG_16_57_8]